MKKLLASLVAVGVLMIGCGGDTGAKKDEPKKTTPPAKTEPKKDEPKKDEKK